MAITRTLKREAEHIRTRGQLDRVRFKRAAPIHRFNRTAPAVNREPRSATRDRWFAVGDPQTAPERFFRFLDRAGALDDEGRVRTEVGLLSIGDQATLYMIDTQMSDGSHVIRSRPAFRRP